MSISTIRARRGRPETDEEYKLFNRYAAWTQMTGMLHVQLRILWHRLRHGKFRIAWKHVLPTLGDGTFSFVYYCSMILSFFLEAILTRRCEGYIVSIDEIKPGLYEVWYIKPKRNRKPRMVSRSEMGKVPEGTKCRLRSRDPMFAKHDLFHDGSEPKYNIGGYFTNRIAIWEFAY